MRPRYLLWVSLLVSEVWEDSECCNEIQGLGQAKGGEVTGEAVLWMADPTAEVGALVTKTRGRNKCYWIWLHTAERWIDKNKGHMPHYHTNLCCYQKTEGLAEMRNLYCYMWNWNIPGGKEDIASCCIMQGKSGTVWFRLGLW